ncbi:sodium-dependent transporter [Colwellia sp. MSW7]|uniref:Sodium-dependent transporter n=1 Tax=Colwellia maritima TaxID=2912588 RepID=A0ABS9WZN1_9GAMM|nr:sodium-dependent transporter [Colwellia maritima]MCI2283454.1 sodium-dependent transporter [Colwellia maritima]
MLGIERWSGRLMPILLLMLISLIIYILQQDGAIEGLTLYLIPDFSQVTNPKLIISAMGQAFFSLSIGVGGMMVYGSYMKRDQDIGKLVISIAALDTVIAFLGFTHYTRFICSTTCFGQEVFSGGHLIGEGQLIFQILPTLFRSMGSIGLIVAFVFFTLLSIAALTSTISTTEVPVSYLVEDKKLNRNRATWLVSGIVLLANLTLISFFDVLFGLVVQLLTTILQPLMSLFYFIVIGWIWQRGNRLTNIATLQNDVKLKAFGFYLRFVCPILLLIVFINVAF